MISRPPCRPQLLEQSDDGTRAHEVGLGPVSVPRLDRRGRADGVCDHVRGIVCVGRGDCEAVRKPLKTVQFHSRAAFVRFALATFVTSVSIASTAPVMVAQTISLSTSTSSVSLSSLAEGDGTY